MSPLEERFREWERGFAYAPSRAQEFLFIKSLLFEEREACAKLVEGFDAEGAPALEAMEALRTCAVLIRGRPAL